MAGGTERVLRRRIKSVQSTKKITRAMELIAATRVAKAQQRVQAARPYSEEITTVIQHMADAGGSIDHPLLKPAWPVPTTPTSSVPPSARSRPVAPKARTTPSWSAARRA